MNALTLIEGHLGRKPLGILIACAAAATAFQASAALDFGGALYYAVLFEGTAGNSFQFNNATIVDIAGNVGIGGTGKAGLSGPGSISGDIDFSAGNTGQYSDTGGKNAVTVQGVNYNDSDVTAALNTINALSTTLGGESGTTTTIKAGGGITANSGIKDAFGDYVFTATLDGSFTEGKTFTITGSASDWVVINVPTTGGHGFNGSIVLSGGITSDHVVINLSGGSTLNISSNGNLTSGIFLDPKGAISIDNSVLDGHLWGGDTHNLSVVSGAYIDAVPEPGTMLAGALLLLPFGASTLRMLRKKRAA